MENKSEIVVYTFNLTNERTTPKGEHIISTGVFCYSDKKLDELCKDKRVPVVFDISEYPGRSRDCYYFGDAVHVDSKNRSITVELILEYNDFDIEIAEIATTVSAYTSFITNNNWNPGIISETGVNNIDEALDRIECFYIKYIPTREDFVKKFMENLEFRIISVGNPLRGINRAIQDRNGEDKE